jgi:Ser/Thr protein kinase RdoA (MazF antagonist)
MSRDISEQAVERAADAVDRVRRVRQLSERIESPIPVRLSNYAGVPVGECVLQAVVLHFDCFAKNLHWQAILAQLEKEPGGLNP